MRQSDPNKDQTRPPSDRRGCESPPREPASLCGRGSGRGIRTHPLVLTRTPQRSKARIIPLLREYVGTGDFSVEGAVFPEPRLLGMGFQGH